MAESSIGHQRSTDLFALLVLGMHRSGTSAVTRVVNLLGADLPKELMYVMDEKENYDIIANNLDKTKKYIKDKLK